MPFYYSLLGHQKIAYRALEAGMHALAVSSQVSLSCSALDLNVDKQKLAQEIFSVTFRNILGNVNFEFPNSDSTRNGTFGAGKPK